MPAIAAALSRARPLVVVVLLAGTVVAAVAAQNLETEAFGEPGKNFPTDDPFRRDHEAAVKEFYDLQPGQLERKTNVIVFEGDMTDPAVHRYMDALQAAMDKPGLDLNTSRNLPFLMRTWLTVKDGARSAGSTIAMENLASLLNRVAPGSSQQVPTGYPDTKEAMKSEMDAAYRTPLATFLSLFVDAPDYTISVMTFATETGSFEVARHSWELVQDSIASVEGQRPQGLKVAFVGNTATNYLFVEQQLPWVAYLSVASLVASVVLVALFFRDLRAVVAVGVMSAITSIWFVGILYSAGIGLAITLVLPLVFISAVGSDYALHLAWNMKQVGDPRQVWGVVGKSIMFSAITTVGAFLVFMQMQNVPMARTMVATVIAVVLSFVLTVLLIPVLYPIPRAPRRVVSQRSRAARVESAPLPTHPDAPPVPPAPRGRSTRGET